MLTIISGTGEKDYPETQVYVYRKQVEVLGAPKIRLTVDDIQQTLR